jgi:uncharacterized protein YecE (DUF72 family)
LKGGRFITHMKKLVHVETALANFFASGVLALGPKLGPILWQLPPMMKFNEGPYDAARYETFFRMLPRTVRSAVKLAKRCDERVLPRACWKPLLFVYIRLHGSEQLYFSGHEANAIEAWAERVVAFATGKPAEGRYAGTQLATAQPRDVFVYFDNDAKVRAPLDAKALQQRVMQSMLATAAAARTGLDPFGTDPTT